MPTTCIVVGCGSRANREKFSFFRVPVWTNYAFRTDLNELSRKRRAKWLAAIRRSDLTDAKIKCEKVCSRHFLTGKPAQLPDVNHPDWAPSLHMGYGLGGSKGRGTKQKGRNSFKKKAKMDDEDIDKSTFTATMEVPSDVLPKLVCENCHGYLSRGPVHLMDIDKYWCGRCLPSEEEQGTRIEAYEELAKLMTFPCRYQHHGCTSKVPFVENEVHEEACPYRKYICPIAESGQCEWTGIQTELLEHCRQDHPDNVVENPCKFTHNITRSSLHNYLLWALGVLFLIQTKVCTATRKIYHSVRLIGDPAGASSYKYTLCIQNKDSNFSKHRQVAPRGCLVLQNDSSIETDINGLLAMLEDFTDTTFTVTVESAGHGPTESSTAESGSQRTSSANTRNTTPVTSLEVEVECESCLGLTEPVYRQGWRCTRHVPDRRKCQYAGCTYIDIGIKQSSHMSRFCKYRTQCEICSADITSTTLDAHYTQVHGDITHRAGAVCTVSPVNIEHEFWIIGYDMVDRVVCMYNLSISDFTLLMFTSLPSAQFYKYRCAVDISHPDTGHTLTCVPTVGYNKGYDWRVRISRATFDTYSQYNKVNIKVSVTKIEHPSEFIL